MLNKEYQKDTDSPLARCLATGIMRLTCEHLSQLNAPYTKPDLSGEKKASVLVWILTGTDWVLGTGKPAGCQK